MKENELKRYVLLNNNVIYDMKNDYDVKKYNMVKNASALHYQFKTTSDNILDLAEVGDCVESAFGGIGAVMEFLEQEGKSKRYRKYGSNDFCYLENPCNIALWKRNGNTMTRYEVER